MEITELVLYDSGATADAESPTEDDEGYLVDFGQNLTGRLELEMEGVTAGDVVVMSHAEALTDDGNLATVDLKSANAVDSYVASGDGGETYEPRFTYHGFRYARITGYPGTLTPEDIVANIVHTDFENRGTFACANEDLNAVQHAAEWSLRGNSVRIPTGGPSATSERGGPATRTSLRALLYNFDSGRFHAK